MRNIVMLNVKVLVKSCPICGEKASGLHHIKPIAVGGKDEPRNKVILCKRCHDIVERIYDKTGIEYCPELVYSIQREFGFSPNDKVGKKSRYITRKGKGDDRIPIPPKLMKKLYWDDGMSLSLMANELGMSVMGIHKKMLRNGIPTRNISEALKNAYKLGRGIGDGR